MRLVNQRIDMNNENMCHIIQSSGSGKSRLVDQLGTEHLVIPICLRDEADNGTHTPLLMVRWTVTHLLRQDSPRATSSLASILPGLSARTTKQG